jgi:subtilisin family serine protease
MQRRIYGTALCLLLSPALLAQAGPAPSPQSDFACRPHQCSTLIPGGAVDAPQTNDCAYRNGNQWWLDHIAGSLTWDKNSSRPVTVAIFDDGIETAHPDLRNQLWTNKAEANGRSGVDDDANGYVDDLHGWDFVDNDPVVAPEGECRGRASHGTFVASLIAAERDNGVGIAAAGADGARVMMIRIVGCGRDVNDRADPQRLTRALDYATRMGAKILSFSAHWNQSSAELDAAFAAVAEQEGTGREAIVVAAVPNRGEHTAGYPAAYPYRRIVRAVPIGNDDTISPGTSVAPIGLNIGAPSACVMGATVGADGYAIKNGSSNSTAILAGLLAGIWSSPRYATFPVDKFLTTVVRAKMLRSARRSQPGPRPPFLDGVPLADACVLESGQRTARVCQRP